MTGVSVGTIGAHSRQDRPCWHCEHIIEMRGSYAWCGHGGTPHMRQMPERGCAFWLRAVGADDDLGDNPPIGGN